MHKLLVRQITNAFLLCVVVPAVGHPAPSRVQVDLTGKPPGHLFAAGRPVVLRLRFPGAPHAPTALRWSVTDFWGTEVRRGTLSVSPREAYVNLGLLPRGYYEFLLGKKNSVWKFPFGVVTDRSGLRPPSGPLNVDGATAWLVPRGRHEEVAMILRTIGVGWVRERFSWGGTHPEPGRFAWGHYDEVINALSKHGVRIYNIFHDSPAWTHKGNANTRNPTDLREAYHFAKRLAERYRRKVLAWEVWNEPDIFFWPDLSDTFSGVQKAAYLGFKSADPHLLVLLGSFCRGRAPFDDHLFEAGIKDYFDIFNWHVYAPPSRYAWFLNSYMDVLRKHGCADRPVWLTEAGVRLKATEPCGELNPDAEKQQAAFIPRSFACSLAAGTDRHFYFVFPYYLERGIQYGALRGDLSPRPSLIAIAAAVDILGKGRYLGTYAEEKQDGWTALAFDSGGRIVLVVWTDSSKPRSVSIPVARTQVQVADLLGRRTPQQSENMRLQITVSTHPQYVIGASKDILPRLRGGARKPGRLESTRPDPVVVRGQAQGLRIDKAADTYVVSRRELLYHIEVCNFSEKEAAGGKVRIALPAGWKATPREVAVELPPLGRHVEAVRITPGAPASGTHVVRLQPRFPGRSAAPALSCFRFARAVLTK